MSVVEHVIGAEKHKCVICENYVRCKKLKGTFQGICVCTFSIAIQDLFQMVEQGVQYHGVGLMLSVIVSIASAIWFWGW